jgi:hypothetical protein
VVIIATADRDDAVASGQQLIPTAYGRLLPLALQGFILGGTLTLGPIAADLILGAPLGVAPFTRPTAGSGRTFIHYADKSARARRAVVTAARGPFKAKSTTAGDATAGPGAYERLFASHQAFPTRSAFSPMALAMTEIGQFVGSLVLRHDALKIARAHAGASTAAFLTFTGNGFSGGYRADRRYGFRDTRLGSSFGSACGLAGSGGGTIASGQSHRN